jgi:choline dehydrogenase
MRSAYDYIVVGGGSGGSVVARRLAEGGAASVLLIEAGPDDAGIADITDAAHWVKLLRGQYDWGYDYAPTPAVLGRTIGIPRGRVLGGSSSINAMAWYRGHPSDYDAWEQAGATGWNFANLLPYFRRAEDWEGGASKWRGAGGPLRITRSADPHPIAAALLQAACEIGHKVIDDPNGAGNEGAALANLNLYRGERWSVARGYLHPARAWRNLAILTGSPAIGLLFERARCVGVRHLLPDGTVVETRAEREVVLALGAIDTPRLLLMSGIGDPTDLRRLDVVIRAALPGVGKNLQDHPLLMGMNFRSRRPLGAMRDNGGGAVVNWNSSRETHAPDLHAFVVQGPHAGPEIAQAYDLSGDVFAISPGLMRARSIGQLSLTSATPGAPLKIQPNFLAEPADLAALVESIDFVADLAATAPYRALIDRPLSPPGRLTWAEKIDFVRQSCSTFFHTSGTAAMGTGEAAVVDPDLRVRGIDGLRIADASVIPVLPSCNTNAPVVAIAERAADLIRAAW